MTKNILHYSDSESKHEIEAGMVGAFRAIVRDVMREELAALIPSKPAKVLLTRAELAEATGYGLSTVARWAGEGCPVIRYGDAPRFELDKVLEWLRTRGGEK